MRIDTVRIRNFRCYKEGLNGEWGVIFRPRKQLNLIIGSNGSGKTALLDAINITLNAEGRSNQALITEYDFPYGDISKKVSIEITLVDVEKVLDKFESDIQWIDPNNGEPVEQQGQDIDETRHEKAVIIQFEAKLDESSGEIEWQWLLPKFPETEMEAVKKLDRSQHQAIGFCRIKPMITSGAFTLGEYAELGKRLKRMQYRLGKLPSKLKSEPKLPRCSLGALECATCEEKENCMPEQPSNNTAGKTLGKVLKEIADNAKSILGGKSWEAMQASLGPRYGGMGSSLSALTLGMNPIVDYAKFLPFERFSSGEKYALSFSLATSSFPGEQPLILMLEEPETALSPSAVASILGELQKKQGDVLPQVLASSHSETVLRSFPVDSIFQMDDNRKPVLLHDVLSLTGSRLSKSKFEFLIMPGEASALFADKVLLVEGEGEAIVLGALDRLAVKVSSFGSSCDSYALKGWCVFNAKGADDIRESIKALQSMGKKVAAVFDGDGPGKSYAEQVKGLCPTFVFRSSMEAEPCLEEALLYGSRQANNVLTVFFNNSECVSCPHKPRKRCWREHYECKYLGDRHVRKRHLQKLCLEQYRSDNDYPPAFKTLLPKLDTVMLGEIHLISIDAPNIAV